MLKVLYFSRFSSELTIDLLFCDLFNESRQQYGTIAGSMVGIWLRIF